MATICITRPNEWMNRARKYKLLLNGEEIGRIKNDDVMEFEVSEGNYQLLAKIDWCTSNTFEFVLGKDEIKYVKLSGFKHSRWIMPLMSVCVFLAIIIGRRVELAEYFYWFLIGVPGIFMFSLFTFRRKSYLWLRAN